MFYIQYKDGLDGLVEYDYLGLDNVFHTVCTKKLKNAFKNPNFFTIKDYVHYMNERFNCQYKAIDEETAKVILNPWKIDLVFDITSSGT
jgi:hypothetical protein